MSKGNHRLIQGFLTLAILLVGVFGAKAITNLKEPPPKRPRDVAVPLVETLEARRGPVELFVEAQGVVVPHTRTMILSEVAGRVVEVADALRPGSRVEEGDVLLRIDDTDYRLAVAEARAAFAQANLALEQARADADNARRDWERSGNEGSPTDLLLRKPQLADAEARLQLARAREAKARVDLDRCVVKAPFGGRVQTAMIDRGQFVARGAQLASLFATDVLEARIPLPDRELALLDLTLGGDVAPDTAPEARLSTRFGGKVQSWPATIVRTEAELDPESRMVVAVARIEVTTSDEGRVPLSVGMFVEAEIRGRQLTDKLTLPRDALRSDDRVLVVDDEDRVLFRNVRVLQRTESQVVVDGSVEEGESVIVSPLEAPVEGMQVRSVSVGQ